MDKKSRELIEYVSKSIESPDVSGFELLELLDTRSVIASREPLLNEADTSLLEDLDRRLMRMAEFLYARISEVADVSNARRRSHCLPSHWWWYLDQIVRQRQEVAR
jgi:hypothetical protein